VSDYKVRADCWSVLVAISECGGDVYSIPPGPDGWHSRASLAEWLAPHLKLPADVVAASFANIDKPGTFKVSTGRGAIPDDAPLVGGMKPVATAAEAMAGQGYYIGDASMTPATAYATGRITGRSKLEWESRYAADPEGVGRTLASLAPVLANTTPTGPAPLTAAEELDILDEQMYGVGHSEMSRKRRDAREDEQILADHRAAEQAQREAAADTLTPDEWRQVFGTEPPANL
jgi:hypothetical protein